MCSTPFPVQHTRHSASLLAVCTSSSPSHTVQGPSNSRCSESTEPKVFTASIKSKSSASQLMFFTPHFGRALSNCSDSILRAPEAPTLARCQAQGARKGRPRVCRRQQSMFNKLSKSAWVIQGARSPIAATRRSGGTHAGAGVGNACGHIEANQSCGMWRCSCSPGHLCVCVFFRCAQRRQSAN